MLSKPNLFTAKGIYEIQEELNFIKTIFDKFSVIKLYDRQ